MPRTCSVDEAIGTHVYLSLGQLAARRREAVHVALLMTSVGIDGEVLIVYLMFSAPSPHCVL